MSIINPTTAHQLHSHAEPSRALLAAPKAAFSAHARPSISLLKPSPSSVDQFFRATKLGSSHVVRRARFGGNAIKASIATTSETTVTVKAVVTVQTTFGGTLSNLGVSRGVDDIADLFGKSLLLELVSSDLDPNSEKEKTLTAYAHRGKEADDELQFEATFKVSEAFGESYLPSQTPSGLKQLREKDLENQRGDGTGQRKASDRIYDYDTYNDLGSPDVSDDKARPVLGGLDRPYPRRCRTGRDPSKKDPLSESRSLNVYVPRDEAFSEVKTMQFSTKTGIKLPNVDGVFFKTLLPRMVKAVSEGGDSLLLFEIPEMFDRDKFSWFKDEEFGRQTLAGLNPFSIKLVTELPLKSQLDPKIYGPPESLITEELIEQEIKGVMTAQEALKNKRLFILDYHDLLLPYVNKVRSLKGTTLYGSRTLFFLTDSGTLRPIAIELTRPPSADKPQWKHVYIYDCDATTSWLWKFAKAHVCAHDAGYHQLVVHWLRTHCCTEPYIIAANRQLSAMHPVYRLLHPHFRYTMEINALARELLINAGGIIESSFSPGKYSIELSSVAYDQEWRFDMEALPADLIRRGMAVEDPTAEHGLKLVIEDYPFANDGLVLWDTIKTWVTDYVNHYYPEPTLIANDAELHAWWTEVRTKGHGDKKDEPWWPVLNTQEDLIQVLSTIIWVTSGHHAAVNFGQYLYGGYFPNRPTLIRANMPNEHPDEVLYKNFIEKPESVLLESFPSQIQATKVMAILDVLSSHSPDEEYLGGQSEPAWAADPVIKAAYERYAGRLLELEGIIDARNVDPKLLNRTGAGVVPYQLLKPSSKSGVTGMGVPNSISI
ncbi:hypothetical protein Syun_002267 [Stephania yunnanensis]|uniref:Lipoxygenase n=1 Tax=Stephania yunnanensis TaxID=152371 RepID=A0AAP0LF31_9MAGN